MTAMPAPSHEPTSFDHPLTIGEYAALGETKSGYTELIEGSLLMSPSPMLDHMIASGELFAQIREQLSEGLRRFKMSTSISSSAPLASRDSAVGQI